MSKFSGKCDLWDEIFSFNQESKGWKDTFEDFKKKTDGVIYINVKPNKNYSRKELIRIAKNKDNYFGLEFDEKNKVFTLMNGLIKKKTSKEVNTILSARIPYRFEELEDLIPFFGCVPGIMTSNHEHTYIEINWNPEPVSRMINQLNWNDGVCDTESVRNMFRELAQTIRLERFY